MTIAAWAALEWGGEAILEAATSSGYIAQADIDPNGGDWAALRFRYADPDNYYAVFINTNAAGTNGMGDVKLLQVVRGKESAVAADTYTIPGSWPVTVKVKVTEADAVTIWVGGTQEIVNTTGLDGAAGGVALASQKALFDAERAQGGSVKEVGYDGSADDDLDDAGGDVDFAGRTITIRDGKARRVDVIPMHPQLATELKCRRNASMALPTAKVFQHAVTTLTVLKDFLRAGLAREEIVRDAGGEPVMIGKGKWRRPKTRIVSEDAEGRVIDPHVLRTTPGTSLARAGVAPQIAQRIMRHSDSRTALQHCAVPGLTDTAQATEALPAIESDKREMVAGSHDAHAGECVPNDPQLYPQQPGREMPQNRSTQRDERAPQPSSLGVPE